MTDAHRAKVELGEWFMKMLEELDEDNVEDADAIDDLRGRVAAALADWRLKHGYVAPPWAEDREDE